MASDLYSSRIDTARLEAFDADIGSFAAVIAIVCSSDPLPSATGRKQLTAARQQIDAAAARTSSEVERLHSLPLPDWPSRRPHLEMVAATLSSAGAWLFELSAAVRAGGNIEMALGWLAQQCGALGEEATAAVKEVDAALAALLAEAKVEASAVKERPGYTLGREGA